MVPDSIVIEGERDRERFLVIVDGQKIFLQPVGFRFFAILAIQLVLGEDEGWIQASQLWHPAANVTRYIYRLKQNIYNAYPRLQSWRVVENDRQGQYRLIAKPETLVINQLEIQNFGDYELGQMMDKLLRIENEQPSYR